MGEVVTVGLDIAKSVSMLAAQVVVHDERMPTSARICLNCWPTSSTL